jgi:hypothetical protein
MAIKLQTKVTPTIPGLGFITIPLSTRSCWSKLAALDLDTGKSIAGINFRGGEFYSIRAYVTQPNYLLCALIYWYRTGEVLTHGQYQWVIAQPRRPRWLLEHANIPLEVTNG